MHLELELRKRHLALFVGGVAALVAILGVVQLLGIAAIETRQLSDAPLAIQSPVPESSPSAPASPGVSPVPSPAELSPSPP